MNIPPHIKTALWGLAGVCVIFYGFLFVMLENPSVQPTPFPTPKPYAPQNVWPQNTPFTYPARPTINPSQLPPPPPSNPFDTSQTPLPAAIYDPIVEVREPISGSTWARGGTYATVWNVREPSVGYDSNRKYIGTDIVLETIDPFGQSFFIRSFAEKAFTVNGVNAVSWLIPNDIAPANTYRLRLTVWYVNSQGYQTFTTAVSPGTFSIR